MSKDKIKIIAILVNFSEGSGPFRRIKKISSKFFEIIILSLFDSNKKLDRYRKYTRHQLIGVAMRNYFDFKGIKNFFSILKNAKPNIVHTFHNYSALLGVITKITRGKIIFIHSFGTDFKRIKPIFRLLHMLLTLRFTDAIICSSHSVMRSLGHFSKKYKHKIFVIENGIDIREIRKYKSFNSLMRLRYNLSEHATVIGSVGRLIPLKNHKKIIEAVSKLNKEIIQGHELKLFIIGDGSEMNNLQKLVASNGLTNLVFFTGQVSQSDVYKFLSMMDIYIQLSLWEGMSASAQEAMAMGIPVILSDIPSHRELLKNGGGILVDPNCPNEAATALVELIRNPRLRRKLGRCAQEIVQSHYNLTDTILKFENLYLQLASGDIRKK